MNQELKQRVRVKRSCLALLQPYVQTLAKKTPTLMCRIIGLELAYNVALKKSAVVLHVH